MDGVDSSGTVVGNADRGDALRDFVDALPWCVDCALALTRLTQLAVGLPTVGVALAYLSEAPGSDFSLSKSTRPKAPGQLEKGSGLCAWFKENDEAYRFGPLPSSPDENAVAAPAHQQLVDFGADAAFIIRTGESIEALILVGKDESSPALEETSLTALDFAIDGLTRVWPEMATEERAESTAQISAGVAHDLRSCLTSISTLVQLCREDPVATGKIRELAPTAEANLKAVNEIVGHARRMTRTTPFQTDVVDIGDVMRRAVALTNSEAKEAGVRITLEPRTAPSVTSEEILLIRSLRNLISNAIRVSPHGGEVRVEACDRDGILEITVSDDGPGMGVDTRRKALSARLTELPHKSGIGLPICRNMIELLGGALKIDSKEGLGTTVTLSLPIAPD